VNPQTLLLILVSVCLSAVAQVLFKFGVGRSATNQGVLGGGMSLLHTLLTADVLGGLALYALGTLLWLSAPGRVDLSQAYPFVGLGFVLTAVLGHMLYGETFGVLRILGTLMVVGGVVAVALG
jgi:drug/metabolite transporter (DMT)-like permease